MIARRDLKPGNVFRWEPETYPTRGLLSSVLMVLDAGHEVDIWRGREGEPTHCIGEIMPGVLVEVIA